MSAVLYRGAHRAPTSLTDSLAASWRWWRETLTRHLTLRPAVRQAPGKPVPAGVAGTGPDTGAAKKARDWYIRVDGGGIPRLTIRQPEPDEPAPEPATVIDVFSVPAYVPQVTP